MCSTAKVIDYDGQRYELRNCGELERFLGVPLVLTSLAKECDFKTEQDHCLCSVDIKESAWRAGYSARFTSELDEAMGDFTLLKQ